jgi:hypothetical protein
MGATGAAVATGMTGPTSPAEATGATGGYEGTWLSTSINQSNVLGSLDAKFLQGGATGPGGDAQPGNQDLTQTGTQLASDLTNVGGWANVLAPTGTNTGLNTGTTPDVHGSTVLPGSEDAPHYHKPLLGPDQH